MAEYIDRKAVLKKIYDLIFKSGKYTDYESGADDAFSIVEHCPAADVATVRRGKWELDSDNCLVCSCCGEPAPQRLFLHLRLHPMYATCDSIKSRYCPNCGAKMEVDE